MTKYLQTDTRWATKTLGATPYRIGRWGCTISSIATGRSSLGMGELNPKELSDKVSFTADGRLLWGSLPVVGLDKLFYAYRWSPQEAKDALKSSDKFCILELSGYHWGLLWSTFPVIRIFDPLSGVRFLGKYKITKTVIIKNILKK